MRTDVSTTRAEAIFRVKRQSPTIDLLITPVTHQMIMIFNHGMLLLLSNHFPSKEKNTLLRFSLNLQFCFHCFVCFLGVLNVRIDEPASTGPQTSDNRDELNAKEENLDSRFPEADFNAVDPAIMEKLAVYIARYSYDPVQHSPNENPEIELAFQAGDYLYVFGDMDEVRW